jgi:hypothetical protein
MRRGSGRLALVAVAALSAWALVAAAAAQASTLTVGSVLPLSFTSKAFPQAGTLLNTALPEHGANLVSPVNGAIVRWRIEGAKGGPFTLRVLRPTGSGAFTAEKTSSPATPSDEGIQTFATSIPIQAGDTIGVDSANASDQIGVAAVSGASAGLIAPALPDGATNAPNGSFAGEEIELSAEIQPAPEVTEVTPRTGPIAGGTMVTIDGTNLTGTNAVKFGTVPATAFSVVSDTEITATAPRTAKPGTVDVAATTIAGTTPSSRADRFSYRACVVPKLKHQTLGRAKARLEDAGCKLGRVAGKRSKRAKVVHQSAKPGTILELGARINVKLG